MNILRISKPQKWRKFKNSKPQTKLTRSYKNDCVSFVHSKQQILQWITAPTFSKILWTLRLTLIFRLNIFHSKTLYSYYYNYSFYGKENRLNWQNVQNLYTYECNLFMSFYIIISLYLYILRMNTFIVHQVHHTL